MRRSDLAGMANCGAGVGEVQEVAVWVRLRAAISEPQLCTGQLHAGRPPACNAKFAQRKVACTTSLNCGQHRAAAPPTRLRTSVCSGASSQLQRASRHTRAGLPQQPRSSSRCTWAVSARTPTRLPNLSWPPASVLSLNSNRREPPKSTCCSVTFTSRGAGGGSPARPSTCSTYAPLLALLTCWPPALLRLVAGSAVPDVGGSVSNARCRSQMFCVGSVPSMSQLWGGRVWRTSAGR